MLMFISQHQTTLQTQSTETLKQVSLT